jgi:hypothetical protein
MRQMRAVNGGFAIEYTQPISTETAAGLAARYKVKQWRYVPRSDYGGPKVDEETLTVQSATVSSDRKTVTLAIPGLKPNRVVHVRSARPFGSADGKQLWSTEAWYTLNQLPATPSRTGEVKGIGGKCLDVDNANTADGTKVQVWTCNSTAAQEWSVLGTGAVRALGKCLDIDNSGTADGTKVQLYTCNGTAAQVWQQQTNGSLRNPQSGKCLDVNGGSSADGTAVHLWTCGSQQSQKWVLS